MIEVSLKVHGQARKTIMISPKLDSGSRALMVEVKEDRNAGSPGAMSYVELKPHNEREFMKEIESALNACCQTLIHRYGINGNSPAKD